MLAAVQMYIRVFSTVSASQETDPASLPAPACLPIPRAPDKHSAPRVVGRQRKECALQIPFLRLQACIKEATLQVRPVSLSLFFFFGPAGSLNPRGLTPVSSFSFAQLFRNMSMQINTLTVNLTMKGWWEEGWWWCGGEHTSTSSSSSLSRGFLFARDGLVHSDL